MSSLMRSSALMAAGSAASRVLGLIRTMLVLYALGTLTLSSTAWAMGQNIPNLVNIIIGAGLLNAILVPQIVKADEMKSVVDDFINSLLTLSLLMLIGVTLLCIPLAPQLVALFSKEVFVQGPGFPLAVQFAVYTIPAIFFYGLYTLLGQVLNARGRFGAFMWAPAVCNVIWIASLVWFMLQYRGRGQTLDWDAGMVQVLGLGMTLGVAAQALILLVPLHRSGFRYRPRFKFRGVGLGSAAKVATWTFASLGMTFVWQWVVGQVTTSVTDGKASRAALDAAYMIFMAPHGLFTVSLVTALFTGMAKSAQRRDYSAMRYDLSRGMRMVTIVTVPVTYAAVVLGQSAMTVFYSLKPGNNDASITVMTVLLYLYIFGLAPFGVMYLVSRAFYALEDARTTFYISALNIGVASILAMLCLWLPAENRTFGVTAASTVGVYVGAVVGLVLLGIRLRGLPLQRMIRTLVRVHASVLPAAAAPTLLPFLLNNFELSDKLHAWIMLVVGGGSFVAVYLYLIWALDVPDADRVVELLARRLPFLRRRKPGSDGTPSSA